MMINLEEVKWPPRVALAVDGLSKTYGELRALNSVSVSLNQGEIRAICGENGAGKSTLVKLLVGLIEPDSGTIVINGDEVRIRGPKHAQMLGMGMVAQELSLVPHLSILDNIWLGAANVPLFHRRQNLRERARHALALLGLEDWSLATQVGRLGVGQRQLVEIARLLARNANLLILDEPTATLNDREIERMIGVLKGLRDKGHSILYITHRLGEVFDLCDSVSVLRNGEHVLTTPVAGLERGQLIRAMLGREINELYPKHRPLTQAKRGIVAEGLSCRGAFRNVSFTADSGQILGIAGQVGSGANLLTRALAGLIPDVSGQVMIDSALLPLGSPSECIGRNVCFVTDDRATEGIFPQLSVLENIVAVNIRRLSPRGLVRWRRLRRHGVKNATRVGVNPRELYVAARFLSGGNQQKLLFGRALREGAPGVLVLNEPTRGIDVGARSEIYKLMRALCSVGYTLIMYSSDLEEIVGMSDAVITIYRGALVARYDAGFIDTAQILSDITHPVAASASAA